MELIFKIFLWSIPGLLMLGWHFRFLFSRPPKKAREATEILKRLNETTGGS